MHAVDEAVDHSVTPPDGPPQRWAALRRRADLLSLLSYLLLGLLVLSRLWRDPAGRLLSANPDDHGFFLYVLAHGERVVFDGANPLFDGRMNVPDGVNMMANTSILALTVPAAPITHWFGPAVSMVLLLTLGLAGTAAAWYRVLSRHLVRSRLAAWVGGLWCGFAPTMVSHANGHINFVSQFVLPFIVWQALRLREPGRVLRGGVVLGLLIVLQVFINEESLLFTALALGLFVTVYAIMARREAVRVAQHFLVGLGVAAGVAVVLLAYPLWFQFTGPGHYQGQPFEPGKYATDLAAVGAYPRQSLAGNEAVSRVLSISATEDNTFFGVFGVVMIIASIVVLWRSVAARSAAIAGLVLLIVSMGPSLKVAGTESYIPLPFGLVSHIPVIDLISVTRFGMVPAMIAGVLLALAADRLPSFGPRGRMLFRAGLVLALVPLLPKPLPVNAAPPLPAFVADRMWEPYTTGDRTLVPVPLPEVTSGRDAMRWFALSGLDFPVPRGYFMGPRNPPADRTGSWNAPRRFTSDLLWKAGFTGKAVPVSAAAREAIRADLIHWRAGAVVLVPDVENHDALLTTLTAAFGAPVTVGGVPVWDMRDLPVPPKE